MLNRCLLLASRLAPFRDHHPIDVRPDVLPAAVVQPPIKSMIVCENMNEKYAPEWYTNRRHSQAVI